MVVGLDSEGCAGSEGFLVGTHDECARTSVTAKVLVAARVDGKDHLSTNVKRFGRPLLESQLAQAAVAGVTSFILGAMRTLAPLAQPLAPAIA